MEYIVKLRHKDGLTIITPYYNYLQYHEWGYINAIQFWCIDNYPYELEVYNYNDVLKYKIIKDKKWKSEAETGFKQIIHNTGKYNGLKVAFFYDSTGNGTKWGNEVYLHYNGIRITNDGLEICDLYQHASPESLINELKQLYHKYCQIKPHHFLTIEALIQCFLSDEEILYVLQTLWTISNTLKLRWVISTM